MGLDHCWLGLYCSWKMQKPKDLSNCKHVLGSKRVQDHVGMPSPKAVLALGLPNPFCNFIRILLSTQVHGFTRVGRISIFKLTSS